MCVSLPDAQPVEIIPQDIPLDIVYEDSSLLVVNKPKGMVVHPAAGNPDGTLVNALLYHCAGRLSGINGEVRPGIVHRIDKDTSGLLVVAKDNETHLSLSQQFAVHSIARVYHTVVYGGFAADDGFVEGNIGRHPVDRKRMAVVPKGGKAAYTAYHVESTFPYLHLRKAPDWANPSDPRTSCEHRPSGCRGCSLRPRKVITQLEGQCLHAKTLDFIHPQQARTSGSTARCPNISRPLPAVCKRKCNAMIRSLKDILVVSDMDNTLLTPEDGVPFVNQVTMRLFCALGGHFTVATGRTMESAGRHLDSMTLSAPAILYGGGVIYDFEHDIRIRNTLLSKPSARRAVCDVLARFPGVGVEIMTEDGGICVVRANEYTYRHTVHEGLTYRMAPLEELDGGWNKVLFACSHEMLMQIQDFLDARKYPASLLQPTAAMPRSCRRARQGAGGTCTLYTGVD